MITIQSLYAFMSQHRLAVLSTISPDHHASAALIGIAVSEKLEIIFDTVTDSRKYRNILHAPRVALVVGWENETTVQYEGLAAELKGKEAASYKEIYFSSFPDGRQRVETWPNLVHFKVEPFWIRYSNFNIPSQIEELNF